MQKYQQSLLVSEFLRGSFTKPCSGAVSRTVKAGMLPWNEYKRYKKARRKRA